MEKALRSKGVTGALSIVSLLAGFFFIQNKYTGYIVTENNSSLSIVSIIGLALIGCSLVLGAYSIFKR